MHNSKRSFDKRAVPSGQSGASVQKGWRALRGSCRPSAFCHGRTWQSRCQCGSRGRLPSVPTAHFAAAVTSRLPRIRCCAIARGTNRDGDTRSVAHSEMTCHGQLHTGFIYSPIAFHSQVMEKGEQSLQKQDATSGAFEIPKQKPVTGATGKRYATCSILKWALKKWKKN